MAEGTADEIALIGFRDIHLPALGPMELAGDALAAFGLALLLCAAFALLLRLAGAVRSGAVRSPVERLRQARALPGPERLVALEALLREAGGRDLPEDLRTAFYRPDALSRLDEIDAGVAQALRAGRG